MITVLKFLVMAIAALAEKAFLTDLRPGGGEANLVLPPARFSRVGDGAGATPHEAN